VLEKDIENLLARYPNEFVSGKELTLKDQQKRLGSFFADIIFEDKNGDLIIAEIKRGILVRDALGQAMQYYGLLRKREPDKEIRLMLVANVIPEVSKPFLSEKLGVEFVEIPISKIKGVALKYGYHFLDSVKPELVQTYQQSIQKMGVEAETGQRRVWIFQANPQRYDVLNALADEALVDDVWEVSRYKSEIHAGHIGLVWMSGKESGIYAVFDITSEPQMMVDSEQSAKYWMDEKDKGQLRRRVKIRYRLRLINNPIFKEELKKMPELENMAVFKFTQATNYPVTNDEWQEILGMLKKRFDFAEKL
jgi:predicted RNA-binding protein with PUA-like domain